MGTKKKQEMVRTHIAGAFFYDGSIVHGIYIICLFKHMQSMCNKNRVRLERFIEKTLVQDTFANVGIHS
jgi:hypothetical protein